MAKSIRLKTAVPGPRSRELATRRDSAVPKGVGHSTPVYAESARGALLTDVDGNVLIDFAGGIGTLNAAHANPEVVRAAAAALEKMTHTCFSVAPYEAYVALAEKLNVITPGAFPKKTMLANSGAEALENAVKIARHATGREAVVVFEHAFHGRTLLTMSMTSKVRPYKFGFGPFAPEVHRLPYPYAYRGHYTGPADAARELRDFFQTQVAAEKVACVVLELVVGEGGFIVAPREWVDLLARFCRDNGILLVIDEVQTGFGRTGRMFACEHYGLVPDVMTMAKSLAGGLPLSAITGRADVMDASHVGGLGGTYTGNPVSCAAALAALDYIERERLPERAARIGAEVERRFQCFVERFPFVGDSRGLGAMRALELVTDRASKVPDKDRTDRVIRKAYESGLLLVGAGTYGNVIRTLMPLVVGDDELTEGLDVLEKALESA